MLRRLTPLRQRTPMKTWRRKPEDRVKEADVAYVYAREGGSCLAPKLARQQGEPIDACSHRLTMEHVHDGYGMTGKRAPSDRRHMVLLCYHHNVDGWAAMHKDWERDYLIRVEGPST